MSSVELQGLPPLRFRDDGYSISYFGTREQFLAAGLIENETLLPGDPGLPRKSFFLYADHPLRITRAWQRRPGWFTLEVAKTASEIATIDAEDAASEARWRREREEREKEEKLKETLHEAAKAGVTPEEWALGRMCRTADQFRAWRTRAIAATAELTLQPFDGIRAGFAYSDATTRRMRMLIESLQELAMRGEVEFDPSEHEKQKSCALARAGLLSQPDVPGPRPALFVAYSKS